MPDYLEPRRLTPATDSYDQEQAAVSEVNQRAAGEDIVGQQVKAQQNYLKQNEAAQVNAARIQREQESAQKKQEALQKQAVTNAKKVGIKTEVDPQTAAEKVVTHENGAPVYEHGFQGDPEAGPDGQHVVKYRTPQGRIYPVPTTAIRSTQDEAGAPQYEFDIQGDDGAKKTVRQPVGSKPIFSIDPKTGMRYTGAPDPETGSVGQTPIGYDPTARSKAVLEQKKLEFAAQQDASNFQADEITLNQNAKETNLAPLKKQLTEAQAAAKKLAGEKLQYKQTPDGIFTVSEWGESKIDPSTDVAGFSKAQAWLERKAAADKTLADVQAAHDPLAAEVQTMQQQRDALAIQHLKASHATQVELKKMEEAHKAGIPVYQPDWQKRLAEKSADPRITAINTQADLDAAGGGPLAEDVRRINLPETGKLVSRLLNSAFNQRPEFDVMGNSTAPTPPMQRPEVTLSNVIGQELSADNVAVKGSDVRKLTESALGISDPENWQVKPREGIMGQMGYHDLIHKGENIGSLNTADNRIELTPPNSAGVDAQQQRLINTNRDGLPIYYSSTTPPLPAPAVKGLIQQGIEIARSTPDQGEAETKLAEAKLSPADLRKKVLSGQLSVQDGRLLNETFHGIKDVDASKNAVVSAFQKHLASPVAGAMYRNGDLATKQQTVNQFMNAYAEQASMNIIQPSRSDLAKLRKELLEKADPRGAFRKGVDFITDLPKGAIAPLAGMAAQILTSPWYAGRKALSYKDTETDIIWNSSRDLVQRLANDSNPLHRMFGQGEMKNLLDHDLRLAADKIQSVDDLPDELSQKIRDAAFDSYHRFTDQNAKDVGTTRDSFDIKKDPTLRAMLDRYLKTADGGTFDGMLQMLSMTGNDRATQKQTMQFLERPRTATAENVMERAKMLDLPLDEARAGQALAISKQLDTVKDAKQYRNVIKQAGKVLGLKDPADIQLALSHLTREETDDPNSWRSQFNSGRVANFGELGTEIASDVATAALTASIVGAPEAVALKGAQVGMRSAITKALKAPVTALKEGVSKIARASMDSLAEKSSLLASGRAMLQKVPGKYRALGIVEPKFGAPLTALQKGRNLGVGLTKAAVAAAPIEAVEEGTMAMLDAAPTPQNLVDSMVMGALGGSVLVPMFAGAGALNRAWNAGKRNQSITDYKATLTDRFNQRMAGQTGFTPMSVDDFDIMQGIEDNPAHQTALQEHAAAVQELGAAQEEHTQAVMEMQDAAAGNAVADVPPSPRLLSAQANAEATAANIEGLASMAFSATNELRALPETERPLYTGVAKAVSGATDYTEAEAKALMGLGGESAVAFQQAQALPSDVSGPAQVSTLPNAPTVTPTSTGHYQIPDGVRIQVPPQAIEALKQRAPSLVPLLGGSPMAAEPVKSGSEAPNAAQPTGSQGAITQQTQPSRNEAEATYAGVAPALEKRLKQHGGNVSYTPEEQSEVNQKWGVSSPFNTPPSFIQGGQGTAKTLPPDTVMDDTPIAETEVLSAIQTVVEKELRKRNTIAGRPLIITAAYQAHDGGAEYNYATDTVRVNPLRLARNIWNDKSAAPTRAEVAKAAELVIDHEVVHAAQMQAARDTFAKLPADVQAAGFIPWVSEHYGKMWREDLKDVQDATLKVYGSILEGRPDWQKAFEALRMIVQDRTAGSTSEAATFLTERIREHLKAALAILKRWYADVMAGVADHPAVKAEIEAIEALLKEPARAPPTEVKETEISPAKTKETPPSLNLNVTLSKRGQVRAARFPDAESVAAFQFKLDSDTAASARSKPEEAEAAKQRGLSLIAGLMKDSPLSRSALEQKLLDYHAAVVAQAEATSPLDTFAPPPFHAYSEKQAKSEVLPPPEGGDIISTLKQEGVNRIGPPTATPEWDWYNELARDAAASKITNRETQRLARAGDITDPKARFAWINANIVSTTGGRSIDEAAEDITASGEELGRAILGALDARQKAAGQPSATDQESARIAQEKEGQASFETFATGSTGTPTTAGDLSRTVEPEWEINIGGEWMAVVDTDPIDESVTLENARFGYVTITGEQVVNITGEPEPPLSSAPSRRYQSPTSLLASTASKLKGETAADAIPGLASMFNPQEVQPATGERSLFEMPKKAETVIVDSDIPAWKTQDGRTWQTETEAKETGLPYYNIEPEDGKPDERSANELASYQRGKVIDLEPPIAPRSILDAYRAASLGQSSAMLPIRSVFEKARELNPDLEIPDFLKGLDAMDDGRALFGFADNVAGYEAAKPFVHGPSGIEMGFQPEMVTASAILSNLDKVKDVRPLLPDEQDAYDKAMAMVEPAQTLASAPSRVALDEAISSIESYAEDPTEPDYWPEDLKDAYEESPLRKAIEDGDFTAFFEALPEDERTKQRQEWYEQAQKLDIVNDKLLKAYRTISKDPQKVFTPDEWIALQTMPETERDGRIMKRVNDRSLHQLTIPERVIYDDTDTSDADEFLESDKAKEIALAPFMPQVKERVQSAIQQIEALGRHKWKPKDKVFEELDEPQILYSAPSRVTPEQDAEYMKAVENGDVAKQQAMVDAAAKAAGYNVGPVWHGTAEDFTVFDTAKRNSNTAEYGRGLSFFTDELSLAKEYSKTGSGKLKELSGNVYKAIEEWGDYTYGILPDRMKHMANWDNAHRLATPLNDLLDSEAITRSQYDRFYELEDNIYSLNDQLSKLENPEGRPRVIRAYLKIPKLVEEDAGDRGVTFGSWDVVNTALAEQMETEGADGFLARNVYDSPFGTEMRADVYAVRSPNQIKSANPITRDADGNIIPLSQRFNVDSDSVLYSAPTESAPPTAQPDNEAQVREILDSMPNVWSAILQDHTNGKSVEEIAAARHLKPEQTAYILSQAQGRFNYLRGQLPTKPKVAPQANGGPLYKGGRPELALSGIPAFAAVDQNRGTPEQVTHAEMQDSATQMFAVDRDAAEKLVMRWLDSGGMAFTADDMPDGIKDIVADAQAKKASQALMTAAAQILTVESAFAGGNSAKIARLIDLYRNSGEETARALSQRRDPFESPAERNAWYLQNVLLVPPPSIRQEMKKNPKNKDKILTEWAARADKIKSEMLADGIDIDATMKQMAKERELAAATIPEPVKPALAVAPKSTRQAVKAILEGSSWQDAINASGLDVKAAQKAYNAFRGGLRGIISKAAAAIRETLGSAPSESGLSSMLPEWTDNVVLSAAPVRNAATQKLAIQRNRKRTQGELDLGNDLSANKARRAIEARKSTQFDKLSEFWRAAILSGPRTAVVNVVSGLTYGTYEATFKKFSAAALADLARLFGMKPDAPSLRDLPSMAAAFIPSIQAAGRDMVKAWNTEDAIFDSFALNRTNEKGELWKEGHTSALKGWVRKIMHAISFRHMGAADEFVKSLFTRIEVVAQARQIARNEGLEGLKMANRISELMVPGSLAWERSLANAKRITFQNQEVGNVKLESSMQPGHGVIDSIDSIANVIQNMKNGDYGSLLKGMMHVMFPFVATPANILKGGITMSPVGSALAIIDATRALMRHKKGNVEEAQRIYNAARALDDFTNQVVCWGFILGLSSLVKPGDDDEQPVMTGNFGSGDSATGEREIAYRSAPPQSVRLWGKWYSYSKLDPWASWLAPTIDSIREIQLGKSMDEAIPNVIGNMLKAMKEKSYFQGLSEVVNAANDPSRFGQRWALGIATGFMPNAIKQSLRANDEAIRDSRLPKDLGFVDQLGRRLGFGMLPHPSNPLALMPAIDVFGRPVTKSTGTGSPVTDTLIRLMSPVEIRNAGGVDPADLMLMHYNMMHDKPFGLVAPDFEIQRTIAGKPVKISLSFEEREGLAKRVGQDFRAAIQPYVDKTTLPTEDEMEDVKDLHRKIAKPYEDAAFGAALQKRIAEGKIKL